MTLANLKLTNAKKPTQISAVVQRRNKLVMRLREQIEMTKAEQAGTAYMPTKLRSVTDTETGVRKQVAVSKRVKSWVFTADNGKLCCIDPVKTCPGVNVEGNDDEHPDGRRHQALDSQA